jgi:hypothetical protein
MREAQPDVSQVGRHIETLATTIGERNIWRYAELQRAADDIASELADGILNADQATEAGIKAQRERVLALRQKLAGLGMPDASRLGHLADYLVKKSIWTWAGTAGPTTSGTAVSTTSSR